jgi:hypothetical protein
MSQTPIKYRVANQTPETHLNAYNAAFEELSLSWRWDAPTYARLQHHGRGGVRAYLETEQAHLLRAYDADFLVDAIEAVKVRCLDVAQGDIGQGNGMMQVANEARYRRESLHGAAA